MAQNRKTKVILWVGLVTIVAVVFWGLLKSYYVGQEYERVFNQPPPLPSWLLAIGPQPGELILVENAHFGEAYSDDPFWPVYGVICTQINYSGISANPDIKSKTILILNGYPIRELQFGTLMWKGEIFEGFNLISYVLSNPEGVNICWKMILKPDDYLATIKIQTDSGENLEYTWAFRLEK